MSHTDYIERAPEGFKIIGHTPVCPVAAMECADKHLYAVQFHPEAAAGPKDSEYIFDRFMEYAL